MALEPIPSREALALRWAGLCADPRWHDLAGKLELTGLGEIQISPRNNRHGQHKAVIGHALCQQLPAGIVVMNCSVLTIDGVRVPDVAWASADFMTRHGDVTPFPQAPEICVEVRSPSNTDAEMAYKTSLFLEAGAQEVWIVSENCEWQVFTDRGQQSATQFGVRLPPGPAPTAAS